MVLDEKKLHEFIGKAVNEWGAAEGALIIFVGDKLGLFKAMAGAGELTPEELANCCLDVTGCTYLHIT
jgi:hypothetical protein